MSVFLRKIFGCLAVAALSSGAGASVVSFAGNESVTSNLVFSSDAELSVADGMTVRALGAVSAEGLVTKTGGGSFVLSTAAVNGKSNGGENAALSVQAGTFAVETPSAVNNDFADGITLGENAVFEMRGGNVTAGKMELQGGELLVTGGTVNGGEVSGSGTVSLSGGVFAAGSFAAEGASTRIDIAEGGTFAVQKTSSADGGELSIHVDGGTFKSVQKAYADVLDGGTVYVGEKGMTINIRDVYAWGPQWKMPIVPEPGVVPGGVRIVSSFEDSYENPDSAQRIRFVAGCTVSGVGGVYVDNAEIMLLAADYQETFTLAEGATIRVAVEPTVTVDGLVFEGDMGRLILGVKADGSETSMLTAESFTPPAEELRVRFVKSDTTSVVYPTAATVDILKIPASVDFPLSRFSYAHNRKGYTVTFSERVEGDWRIISMTSEEQKEGANFRDVHKTDDWMTGDMPWRINNVLYRYAGGSRTVSARMLAYPGGSEGRNSMISVPEDVNLSLAGGAQQMLGGFMKFGDGTLTFGGDKAYDFAYTFSVSGSLADNTTQANLSVTNASGTSTRTHQGSLTVAAGTLVIGTGSDTPVVSVDSGEVNVGTATTAEEGAERDAAMVMNSGVLNVLTDPLMVGRTHGIVATQSKTPLESSFTLNGGSVSVKSAGVAYDVTAKSSMDARIAVNGGEMDCRDAFYLGTTGAKAAAASTATLEVNGGTLDIGTQAVALGTEGRLLVGYKSAANLSTVFTVNGGTVTLHAGAAFYENAHHTVNLNEGGTLVLGGDFKASTSAGSSVWNWNGGVLRFDAGVQVSGFKTVNVGPKDAILDITGAGDTSWFNQALTGEGRLVVRTEDPLAGVQIYGGYDGCAGLVIEGPVRAVIRKDPKEGFPVLVKDGGGVVTYYSRTFPQLTMGEDADDRTSILGYDYAGRLYRLAVSGTLTVNGKVYVGYRYASTGRLSLPTGTHEMLRAPKGQLDVTQFEIHPELVARGAVAVLSVDTTSNKTYDILIAEVTSDPWDCEWQGGASGAWSDEGNWSGSPAFADATMRFPSTLEGDATVDFTDARVRCICHDGPGTVTLTGNASFPTYAEYDISQPTGVLAFDGLLKFGSPFTSYRTSGAGTLRIDGRVDGSPAIVANSGRIEGAPASLGSADLTLANTTVRFTESGTFSGSIVHENKDATGIGVEVTEGKTVYATGPLNNATALQKLGPGTVVFCRTGTKASVTNFVGRSQKKQGTVPYMNGTNGDVPNGPPLGVYAGTIAFDGDENTQYAVEGTTWIGFHPVADGTGGAYDANLDVYGGTLTLGSLNVNRLVSKEYDAVNHLGLTRSPRSTVNVYGGTLRVLGGFILGYPQYVSSCISELNVSGGLFEVHSTNAPSGFGIGYHDSAVATSPEELSAVINISGDGIVRKVGSSKICVGGYGGSSTYLHNVALNMTGGRFEAPEADFELMYKNSKVRINLDGGVVDINAFTQAREINSYGSSLDFRFSGGTYRPNAAESTFPQRTMSSFTVGEGGARFDLCETNTLTLAQALTTATGVEKDGGIALTATDDAYLMLSVANSFNGPITVDGGTILPAVAEAAGCAEGVVVNGTGIFDANGFEFTYSYLRGAGGTYANGALTVTGDVTPTAGTLTIASPLTFADGSVFNCAVSGSAEEGWTAPYLIVDADVTRTGTVYFDLGCDESDPLPVGCCVKIAEVSPGVSFPAMRGRGTGSDHPVVMKRVVRDDGVTEILAEVVPVPLVIIFR